jgi:predicted Zn-dependent protease
MSGCVTVYNSATGRNEMYFISEAQEIAMGKNLAQKVKKDSKIINDPELLAYVRNIGNNLSINSDRNNIKYTFNIVDDKSLNAFALPGGYIFVHKGLIDNTTKEELAFVLAHEIGHVAARHSLKRLQGVMGINLVLGLALKDGSSQLMNQAIGIIYKVVSSGYSRQDEFLADSLAVKYTHKSGFKPQAGVSLMEKLAKEGGGGHMSVFLSSHPAINDRIANIRQKIADLG